MKKFIVIDNEIILNPDTDRECNITKEHKECEYCIYDYMDCVFNGKGRYKPCGYVTLDDDWVEILVD